MGIRWYMEEEKACRICLETDGIFISPCLCKGSMKYIHMHCIEKWRKLSTNPLSYTQCEQCKYVYKFTSPKLIDTIFFYVSACYIIGWTLNAIIDVQGYHVICEPFSMGFLFLSVVGLLKNPLLCTIIFTIIMDERINEQFIHIILTIGTYYSFSYMYRFQKTHILSIQTPVDGNF